MSSLPWRWLEGMLSVVYVTLVCLDQRQLHNGPGSPLTWQLQHDFYRPNKSIRWMAWHNGTSPMTREVTTKQSSHSQVPWWYYSHTGSSIQGWASHPFHSPKTQTLAENPADVLESYQTIEGDILDENNVSSSHGLVLGEITSVNTVKKQTTKMTK